MKNVSCATCAPFGNVLQFKTLNERTGYGVSGLAPEKLRFRTYFGWQPWSIWTRRDS